MYMCQRKSVLVLLSMYVVIRIKDKERKRERDQDTTRKVTNQLAGAQYLQGGRRVQGLKTKETVA